MLETIGHMVITKNVDVRLVPPADLATAVENGKRRSANKKKLCSTENSGRKSDKSNQQQCEHNSTVRTGGRRRRQQTKTRVGKATKEDKV